MIKTLTMLAKPYYFEIIVIAYSLPEAMKVFHSKLMG